MGNSYKATLRACCIGYVTQAIVVNLAPVLFIIFQDSFKISFEMLGRLILINFGTQLTVDALAVRYADRIGYRISVVAAHVFSAVGLIAMGILPLVMPNPYTGLVISVVLFAIGGGLIEVLVSPIVDSLPGKAKASTMSLLHAFYCWGQVLVVLLSTLALWRIGGGKWFLLPIVWSLVPIYNAFRFLKVPLMPLMAEHEKMPVRQLLNSKIFILALVLMTTAGASELAMSQWASLFAEKGLQVPKVMGDILGPCLFALLMGMGRTVYGIWGHKIKVDRILGICAVFCIVCYAVTALIQNPVISLLGCAFCGLAVSLMWPGMISMTARRYPNGGTALFGIMAIFGDLGCALGPWLAGLISDVAQKSEKLVAYGNALGLQPEQLGLKSGIAAAAVFPIIMVLGLLMFRQRRRNIRET